MFVFVSKIISHIIISLTSLRRSKEFVYDNFLIWNCALKNSIHFLQTKYYWKFTIQHFIPYKNEDEPSSNKIGLITQSLGGYCTVIAHHIAVSTWYNRTRGFIVNLADQEGVGTINNQDRVKEFHNYNFRKLIDWGSKLYLFSIWNIC